MYRFTDPDKYVEWRQNVPVFLREFEEFFKEQTSIVLDYSVESLDQVEEWILENYPDSDAMIHESNFEILNWLTCYVGEVRCKAIKGRWHFDATHDNLYREVAVIYEPNGSHDWPETWPRNVPYRRTGSLMSTKLKKRIEDLTQEGYL